MSELTAPRAPERFTSLTALHDLTNEADRVLPVVQSGDPVAAIVDAAADSNQCVALATRNVHGLTRIVLGSVAREVIRRSPTPVLVVPPEVRHA